jgi:hypothetical protein
MSECEEVRDPGTPPDHAFARFSFDSCVKTQVLVKALPMILRGN